MASFQAKTGWKMLRMREYKNYRSVPTRLEIENSKKIAKIFKKLKNTIMTSFQAKTGWLRPRKREYKKYCSVSFLPDVK